ncbi:hypothetical protein POM88_036903 [Heracleum sosnowskyi]|uniref:BED-type domain-containing protein n=1 Tax=Heracleum sosnowskyi TaxID=360622 RepID=A0AAD8HQ76_9APIA|nr:hypothetical protein POM88_036903 [Heracleum sosnowskyi]
MEGPSENQIPQEEAPTKQTDELIHVNLEDEGKCNDKQDDGDKGKKGSVVWDYFNKIPGCPVGKEKAKCSLCNVIIGCFSRNGTSAMMNHLKTVCPKSPLRNNLDKLQKTLRFEIISKEDKSRTFKAHAFNQERHTISSFPPNFADVVKTILKRLFRVYSAGNRSSTDQ